jgi:aminoglycoside phosphotransferase
MEFEIGDTIVIINNGHQYTTHIDMAIELGADVSNVILKHLSQYGRSYINMDYNLAKEDRSCKWVYNSKIDDGDVCKLLKSSGDHYLVERIFDGRQFLMAEYGIKFVRKAEMFCDKDFLL